MNCAHHFDFERLLAYQLALEVARAIRRAPWPSGTAHLRDQAIRAAESVVLNTAEGVSRGGNARTNHLRIAKGSAGEALAALELADLPGADAHKASLRKVGALLTGLGAR